MRVAAHVRFNRLIVQRQNRVNSTWIRRFFLFVQSCRVKGAGYLVRPHGFGLTLNC
jgi:hypothetical protein